MQRAELCDANAARCVDTPQQAEWLELAGHWRSLASDAGPQATTARLIGNR